MADDITARSLTLVDSEGRPRIIMHAGDKDGFAHFSLISTSGDKVSIMSQPNGAVVLSFDHQHRIGQLTVSKQGVVLRDGQGKLAVTIGDQLRDGFTEIIVYRDGQPIWKTPLDDATRSV